MIRFNLMNKMIKNQFLKVYLVRPSNWWEIAGPCETLV